WKPCGSRWRRPRSSARAGRSRRLRPGDVVKLRSRAAPNVRQMQPDSDQLQIELESFPAEVRPMQAASAEAPFSSAEYLFEVKWDGLRCILFRDPDGQVRLKDRGLNDLTADLPEVATAARRVPPGSVIDGELVATDTDGRPDYPRLRQRLAG